jgi:O-acetyl-ADP-ribose deacetylase
MATTTKAAIVNAANTGCLGGGGIDGAITTAGGLNLANDRLRLPVIQGTSDRCRVGQAVMTGPNTYGDLMVPYVIHAVGPDYNVYDDDEIGLQQGHVLLKSAYQSALDLAVKNELDTIAFSLLSAGVYRGSNSLDTVLEVGVQAIVDWCENSDSDSNNLDHVCLCAFTSREYTVLQDICDRLLEPKLM